MAAQMYAVRSAVLRGVEAQPVVVEVSVSQGSLPGITIVGMPDAAVLESKYRVRTALNKCGFEVPRAAITVNLAPSEVKKTGTGFDLPIAVGILACTGQIPRSGLDDCLFVGELSLEGAVSPVRGLVAYGLLAEEQGLTFVGPTGSVSIGEGDTRVIHEIVELKRGVASLRQQEGSVGRLDLDTTDDALDFADVIDQELAKRAFVIAAAGEHGLLMVGPPGAGKSMMAKRMPTILSPLSEEEQAETLLIYSVAGQDLSYVQSGMRPFRAPHHTVTRGGLLGGGRPMRPGEVSLAHNGVLFLDELPEFGPGTLQSLRQPMEDHEVHLVRVEGNYTFPCDFLLVAAANPCPCGYLGDPDHTCTCSATQVRGYQSRIGGPLIDRIDVHVDVARPSSSRLIAGERGVSSRQMREEVRKAREFSSWRRSREKDSTSKRPRSVQEMGLDGPACAFLEGMATKQGLGARSIVRIARVARTIADLEERQVVGKDQVIEAYAYRTRSVF